MTLGLEIYTLFTLYILKLKPNSNYQLHIYVQTYFPQWNELSDRLLTSHYAGLVWEIATSPIVLHGRSAAQPRVGTQKCRLLKTYLRYLFQIVA